MPVYITILITKTILRLSRALGRGGGSALPGLVALKLNPNIGAKIAATIKSGSVIITGTNGKTTTSKMLVTAIQKEGYTIVANRAGSNLARGIVSTLIEHCDMNGRISEDVGVFEVDEAAMPEVCRMLQPKLITVLNLFRDQLDRYGELDSTATLIGQAIAATDAAVLLNADDPLVSGLKKMLKSQPVYYFGLSGVPVKKMAHDVTADSINCPLCGRALKFSRIFFGHIGHYACSRGHFNRPKPEFVVSAIKLAGSHSKFKMSLAGDWGGDASLNLPGVYNIYNAAAVFGLGYILGLEPPNMVHALKGVSAAFGRVESLVVDGKKIYLLLIKNPTGFNQIIQTFLLGKKSQPLLIAVNDKFADGRDVSWLWDVAFEEFKPLNHSITASGIRASDLALRLKYAGIGLQSTEPNLKKALNNFIGSLKPGQAGYIVPTYTAMLELRKILGKKTDIKGIWE
ncbi:MAG TPA: MurT ligase domain-containing protein [Candidatus Dormibacteraeota bacterium]|nr:MurT ligase domain-containing protein [Candidatus Dormibacteraeota bacterium]